MTASRPDLLPLALPTTIGLPYHGLVTNGVLALPDAATMPYPQPAGGETIVVRGPNAVAPNRTAAEQEHDTAKHKTWQDYALLSGSLHEIGGQQLGTTTHLYADGDATWRIRTALSQGVGTCTVRVYLTGLFGYFSGGGRSLAMTERELTSYTWTPKKYDGSSVGAVTVGTGSSRSYKRDGSVYIVNVGSSNSTATAIYNQTGRYLTAFAEHDALKITISGLGSTVTGSVGTGISASISHYKWASDMYSVTTASTPGCSGYCDYQETRTATYHWTLLPDGTETYLQRVMDIHLTEVYENYNDIDVYDEVAGSVSFAGITFTSLHTWTGHYASSQTVGTHVENGVSRNQTVTQSGAWHLYTQDLLGHTIIYPTLVYAEATNKTAITWTATGVQYSCDAGELDSDNWTMNLATGVIAHSVDDDICYV